MRKIPTIFERDPENRKNVTSKWERSCAWVANGEATASRKYDGTCMLLGEEDNWFYRHTVKPNKQYPEYFSLCNRDGKTGKSVGWMPLDQSWQMFSFKKQFEEALDQARLNYQYLRPGTYELCGPGINANPENMECHRLIRHAEAETILLPPKSEYSNIKQLVTSLNWEGLVFRHPDGRMAKIKKRDFE